MAKSLKQPNYTNQNGWSLTIEKLFQKMLDKAPVFHGIVNDQGLIRGEFVTINSMTSEGMIIDGKQADMDVNEFFENQYHFFKYQIELRDKLEKETKRSIS